MPYEQEDSHELFACRFIVAMLDFLVELHTMHPIIVVDLSLEFLTHTLGSQRWSQATSGNKARLRLHIQVGTGYAVLRIKRISLALLFGRASRLVRSIQRLIAGKAARNRVVEKSRGGRAGRFRWWFAEHVHEHTDERDRYDA